MNKRAIIIDTDPGQDDAVALLLALASPELDVLGVTAVAGNVPLSYTYRNARMIVELAGRRDVPVYAGAIRPLLRAQVTAENVHGKTGLDGPQLPEPTLPVQHEHAVDFIVRTLRERPAGSVTLCALGPLTNLALALIRAPDVAERIGEIVLMGGAYFEGGNTTPSAEYNIYADPHAAQIVIKCGAPVVMMPLDVTHQVRSTPQRIAAIAQLGNRAGEVVAQILSFTKRFDMQRFGNGGTPLHDPCVIAYLLRPELFAGRRINVEIETRSDLTLGATVADWWGGSDRPANATFMRSVDADGFYSLLGERLATLP